MSERLISADKIIADMEQRVKELLRVSFPSYDIHSVVNALEVYIDRLKSDRYLPNPTPVQPAADRVKKLVRGLNITEEEMECLETILSPIPPFMTSTEISLAIKNFIKE